MAEKAGAFLRGEVIEEFADTISEGDGGAPGSFAKQSFALLDGFAQAAIRVQGNGRRRVKLRNGLLRPR
jgi:hypothetical protein